MEVRVIDETGQQAGVMTVQEALKIAREKGLDLIQIAESAIPPVCKFGEYGKYKYELEKREKLLKKKQRVIEVKEVRIRPQISEHDLQIKMRNIRRFLEEGCRVKINLVFKGRQMEHQELGSKILQRLETELGSLFIVEQQPRLEGTSRIAILAPKR
ncbi:translation initiation factor IF-3 [Candidatus Desantisbacteria bacterium CG1_02_38_46]|nr:MAG: translation initiation factor IF-3 [Candidatus Desantisbacteria bacterium CG1_02_38_46]